MAGDRHQALEHYRAAANGTASIPERNYLIAKAARLVGAGRNSVADPG
jgi:hypothetical protein